MVAAWADRLPSFIGDPLRQLLKSPIRQQLNQFLSLGALKTEHTLHASFRAAKRIFICREYPCLDDAHSKVHSHVIVTCVLSALSTTIAEMPKYRANALWCTANCALT